MNFADELTKWYLINKRDLPWRNTSDAYTIWLSEIILQQTRVEQGMPYFLRFLENYPDVIAFANAAEDDILRLWQGLGYYSRGRNMLKTAQLVKEIHNGVFPVSYEQLIRLKGIGEYTAAAISSFAANEAKAVVDGNVYRVLARYFDVSEPINSSKGKKLFHQLAEELLNKQQPGLHNQTMMEFGAMVCKPKNPLCRICPIREGCLALQHNTVNLLPVKLKTVKIRERFFNYFLIARDGKILMNKRDNSDIWANMYDLPMIETSIETEPAAVALLPEFELAFGKDARITIHFGTKKHILTHQRLFVKLISVETDYINPDNRWFFTEVENLHKLAFPKIIFIFLNNLFNL